MNSSIWSVNCIDFVSDSFIYMRLYKLKLILYAFLYEDSLYVFIWDGRLNYVIYYHVRCTYICVPKCMRSYDDLQSPKNRWTMWMSLLWFVNTVTSDTHTRVLSDEKERNKIFCGMCRSFYRIGQFHDFLRAMLFRISCKILNSLWLKLMNSENFGFVCL